jgi:hypothetical protein
LEPLWKEHHKAAEILKLLKDDQVADIDRVDELQPQPPIESHYAGLTLRSGPPVVTPPVDPLQARQMHDFPHQLHFPIITQMDGLAFEDWDLASELQNPTLSDDHMTFDFNNFSAEELDNLFRDNQDLQIWAEMRASGAEMGTGAGLE